MRKTLLLLVSALVLTLQAAPASAIQCVPYAREVSGINLKGDAWKWWNAAAGLYDRGRAPKDGAVLVFTRQGSMRHGHVSVVTRVVSKRLVLVDHANWAPVRASGRGEITRAVPVLDVSPKNDWSQVRVWFHPNKDFGNRAYRTDGFVYQPKVEGTPRPAVHQAALHEAEKLFPSQKIVAKAADTTKPATPAKEMAKVEPAKIEPGMMAANLGTAEIAPATTHPAANGLIKVAKHAFRPRQPGSATTLDTLLFN